MAVVTVKKPTQVQVEVSANTVQNVFTETDPSLNVTPPSLSTTSVSLEEPGAVSVAGSLASIKNYFQGQDIDFSSGGMQLGTETIKLFGANNTIQLGNSYISLADNGNIMLNGETAVKLQEMSDVPDIVSGDAGKFLKILPDESGYTYHDIGIFHHTNTFIDLKDTPSTYGTDGQLVKINPTANGFIYFTPSWVTQSDVDTSISSTVNKTFIDALNVDAGTLDGLDSTTIQNYNNLTNRPFIPSATSHLTNNSNFITSASLPTKLSDLTNDEQFKSETWISQKITDTVIKSYVDNLNVDASTVDGIDSTDLQNYNLLTNKPTIPTTTGALTNDAGFITISSVPTTLSDLSNDTDFVNKTYVDNSISNVIDAAPEALNTLNELAQALGDDSNFISTVTTQLAAKANTSSLAAVATSGKFVDLIDEPTISTVGSSGDYDDLINKPSIYTQTETFTLITNRINSVVNKGYINALDVDSTSLGGYGSAHYLNYQNFTNKPVIPSLTSQLTNDSGFLTSSPTALSELTNDVNFTTTADVNSVIQNNVTKTFIDGLLVDAGTLDGKDVTTIQDYTNLTNKPDLHAVATSGSYTDLINKPDLKTVATSGSYTDLINSPSIYSQTESQELIANTVTKTFIDGLLVNAGTIDGKDYTDLLNKHTSVISDLSNVTTESLPDGAILKYNLPNATWVSSTIGAVVASDVQIGDLKNVSDNVNSTFANGYFLKYNTDNPTNPWDSGRIKYSEILNTPTNLSDFTNDSEFITISSVPANIGDLSDVSSTAPSSGEVLKWDGNKWGPAADTGGSGGSGGSGGDATTLDGFDSPYFLDYTNLTNKPALSTVATTGVYSDLTNKPTYSAVATSGSYADLTGTPTNLSDFANDVNFATTSYVNTTITSIISKSYVESLNANVTTFDGANSAYYLNYTNLTNKPTFHAVATSGSYADLGNRPTIPTTTSELTNDSGFVTSVPTALSELANDVNFATTSYVNTTITDIVTKSFVETLDPNVITFNGANSAFYLNYENFTNKPNITGIIGLTITKGFVDALNVKANNTVYFDGQDSNYYLEYSNLENAPYVPATLENLTNVSNTAPTAAGQVLTWDGNKWASAINIPANNTVMNADTLDGFDSPYFLNYSNFTGTFNKTIDEIPGSIFGATLNLHSFSSVSNTSPSEGQALVWDSTLEQWKPGTVASSGGGGTVDTTANNIILGTPRIDYGGDLLLDGASVVMKANNTVSDAIDILNETILNIRDNTYVRHAEFTSSVTSDASGHTGHNHSPVTVQFTDAGDYTLSSPQHLWTFVTSSGNQTSSSQNPSFTWTENSGGTFLVTHRVYSNAVKYPGSAGSFSEHTANVVVTTPLPVPAFSADDTSIDLDGGGTTVNFTSTSQHATHYMWEFGDGTVHPTGADDDDPTGTISTGVAWSTTADTSHLYTGTSDTQFTVKLHTWHSSHNGYTPHSSHVITETKTNYIKGYVAISPTFSSTTLQGNNQDTTDNDVAVEGHKVTFTDTTSGMGSGFGQALEWQFSDNSSDASFIKDSSGSTGHTASGSSGGAISRYFSRNNTSAPATVSYNVKLIATSGHSSSPFESSSVTVIVNKDPRAGFTYTIKNNPTGHSNYNATNIGFFFTGYDGLNYGIGTFTDTSVNTNSLKWDFNNDGTTDSTDAGPVDYSFPAAGTYSSKLIATGDTSESITDDTETKTNIFTINDIPTAPSGLTGKTFTIPASTGTNPALCSSATNNSTENAPSAGSSVNRQTTSNSGFETSVLSDYTNKFAGNGTTSASIKSFVNGVVHGNSPLDETDQSNTNVDSIYITDDVDSNSITPATYPLNFYRQIKAKISKSGHTTGYNTYQMRHSDGTNTAVVGWVQDDLTVVPTCSTYGVENSSLGTLRYMSSVPYYNTSGEVSIGNLTISNITGQTYNDTNSFLTVENNTGTAISSQTYTYSQCGLTTTPAANLKTAQNIPSLNVNINGSSAGEGTLKLKAVNVNGTSSYSNNDKKIKYWFTTPSFDETSLSGPSTTMKRVALGLSGAYPSYTAANFYSTNPWNSQTSTVTGTDEAVVTPSGIEHITTDFSTGYVPVGPDLSSSRSGTQYFTAAFNKGALTACVLNITGEIVSCHLTIPGLTTNSNSGLNGWFDCAVEGGGAGLPGTLGGGNGSDGLGSSQYGLLQLNSSGSQSIQLQFYQMNSSGQGNQSSCILIRFGIASGKSVTAFSVST